MSIFKTEETEDLPDPIWEQFQAFDKDGSGILEGPEAIAALTTLGSSVKLEDIDKDGDGCISFEEFQVFLAMGDKHTHPIFKKAQEVGTATGISVFAGRAHENEAFMQTAAKAWRKLAATTNLTEADLNRAFRRIDIDNDGFLDPGEIRLAIKNIAPQITEMEITLMLATSDRDSDGKVTFEEWKGMMMHNHTDDVNYWEVYGERDMNVGLKDRRKKK